MKTIGTRRIGPPSPGVTIEMEKSAVPVLWLDTFAFIKLAKIEGGEVLPGPDQSRLLLLKDAIARARQRGRLICIEGHQDDEVQVGHGDVEQVRGCMARTTGAVRLRHRDEIENFQFYRMAQAFLRGDRQVRFPFGDAFDSDSVAEATIDRPYLLTCYFTMTPEEQARRLDDVSRLRGQLDALRKANLALGVTFEQQREREYRYLLDAAIGLQEQMVEKANAIDLMGTMDLALKTAMSPAARQRHTWVSAGGDIDHFWDFVDTEHYRAIPSVDIYSNLHADILTGTRKVDQGDAMDIHHLASALPYCHFALLDKRMSRRVRRLGLDTRYGFRAFSMVDVVDLVSMLDVE